MLIQLALPSAAYASHHRQKPHHGASAHTSDSGHARRLAKLHKQHLAHQKALLHKQHAQNIAARHKHLAALKQKHLHALRLAQLRESHKRHQASSGYSKRLAHLHALHEQHLARLHRLHEKQIARHQAREHAHFMARLARMSPRARQKALENYALRSGSVVAAAESFRGTRYRFGGTSRSGFDCSGFTRYILGNAAGVSLPRTAEEQFQHGRSVPTRKMKAGDLVFFRNTYRRGISHVGIYVGNGKFVHAANSHRGVTMPELVGCVIVNRTFVDAIRIAATGL
jgi:cell wall-associated NlpC family hydrolase